VGLIPGFADAFDDMVDFLLGGFLLHVENHRDGSPLVSLREDKSRDPWIAACG